MGELNPVRPGVTAAETGARWLGCACLSVRLAPRGALDHSDLYDLAAELAAATRALEDLFGVLADRAEAYAEREDLRDDEDADPTVRLQQAASEALAARELLSTALRPANAFWSAVGHIGLRLDPEHDEHKQDQDAITERPEDQR